MTATVSLYSCATICLMWPRNGVRIGYLQLKVRYSRNGDSSTVQVGVYAEDGAPIIYLKRWLPIARRRDRGASTVHRGKEGSAFVHLGGFFGFRWTNAEPFAVGGLQMDRARTLFLAMRRLPQRWDPFRPWDPL